MNKYSVAILLVFSLVSVGCKKNTPQNVGYQAKYREANLVGEWVHQEIQLSSDQYSTDKETLIEDTLVFGYKNDVISRKKTTMHNVTFRPEEVWGIYEIVRGKYHMTNDTLVISYDYPNAKRTTFGKDPTSIFPTVYIKAEETVNCYYAVKDLSSNDFTLIHFLREWHGGGARLNDKVLEYRRR